MRQLKKWCAGILAGLFAVTLAGCAAVPGQQETTGDNTVQSLTGGYLEEDISPDHNDNVGLYAVGDVLHAVTIENAAAPLQQQIAHWYTMGPDGSWQENEANGFADAAAQVPEASAASCNAYLAQDGSLYWRITVIREEPEKTSQSYLFAVQDGKARLLDTPPVGEVSLWMDDTTTALAVCGDTILVTDNTMEPHAYDNQGNPAPMKFPDIQGRLLCGNATGYYWLDAQSNLQYCLVGGTTVETVLDGSRYALTSPGMHVRSAAAIDDDTIYIQMSDGNISSQNQELYRYRWDETLEVVQGGELTVFSLYQSRTVEAAVDEMIKQTGAGVTYTYALGESTENGQAVVTGSREDALTQLNTQLLAGSGPDVIILDDMPVQSMIEKGVLADLTGIINTDGLLSNMAGVWQTDAGLYAVPARCVPLLFGGIDTVMADIPDAETLAQRLAAEPNINEAEYNWQTDPIPLMAFRNTEQLFDTFYPLYAGEIWQNNELNAAACRTFLEMLNRICQGGGRSLNIADAAASVYSGTSYYTPSNGTSGSFMNAGSNAFCDLEYSLSGLGSYFQYYTEISGNPTTATVRAMTTAAGQSCIQPSCVAGINASSQNPEGAAQFLQILLGQTVQEQDTYDGYPTLATAVQAQWQAGLSNSGVQSNTDMAAVLQEMDVVQPSTVLRSAMLQAMQCYLESGSAEEAIQTARDTAVLWLAEQ